MSEALERIRAILSRELPDAEVQDLVTELTIASGRGAVAIDGDAMEAVIITGSQNIVGDNNRVVINQGTNPEELVKMLRNLVQEMQQVDSTPELSPEELQDATLAFLQDIAGKFRETQLFHTKQPIILKDQYVPIQVTLEPHKRDVETLRGYWETEEELKRAYALRGGEEELKRQQVDWQEAKQTHQRIMVLADPGMGKSTLLRMEAGSTAERKLQTLQQDETTLDRLTLPLFLRLSELAKRPEELIETIPFLIQRDYPNTAPLILPLLTQKLKTGKCLLLLDALDEVPKIDRNRIELKEKVDRFMQNYPCPVICTSRIVGYDGNFLVGGQEVEIVPFGEQQIEQYVTTWFTNAAEHISDESVSAAELMRELHSKPQVRGLVQNPLLLSLICSLYQEKGLTLPARRTQVYEKAVEYMLMKWSKEKRNPRQGEEDWADLKQELLEELAYQFSCEDTEVVSRRDLRRKIDQYLRGEEVPSEFRNVTASDLLVELTEQDGILQKLAPDGDQYLFLHRTFQEYLTASYLARARGGIELAQAHFWEYDWHETICLMAGLLEDPIPLLKTIISERDDSFYSLLLLAGQCVTECENSSHGLMHEICERIYSLWRSHPSVIFFSTTVRLLAQSNRWVLEKLLYESLNDSSKVISFGSVQIIGEIATPQMTSALAQAFENSSNHVRIGIILALGRIGDRETIEFLILALEKDNVNIRKWTLNVLRKLKKSSVIYPLIEKSFPSDHYAIDEVVTALEKAISFSIEYKAHQQEYSLLGREFIISILSSGFSFLYAESRRVIIGYSVRLAISVRTQY
jgi:energy-coupling factor transporter ATP-binding protein EcfA2